jgi:hypothetical protein
MYLNNYALFNYSILNLSDGERFSINDNIIENANPVLLIRLSRDY